MKNIFIAGAGRSSGELILYLLNYAEGRDVTVTVGDTSLDAINAITGNHPSAIPLVFNVNDPQQREAAIASATLVISLMPPHLHTPLMHDCVRLKRHFLNASYLTPEFSQMNKMAEEAGILILLECGLDPGIDHMSAMQIFDHLRADGAEITSFRSYTGGLVAPESDDNPWGYKFSWNPRNVILAGQGTARYIHEGEYKYIPYSRIFSDVDSINVEGLGRFDGYANRDSLSYRHLYGLTNIPTLIRGTLRKKGYCRAWNVFVQLGLTDDTFTIEKSEAMTWNNLVRSFLPNGIHGDSTQDKVARLCGLPPDGEAMTLVEWTGIFGDTKTGVPDASPAMLLQKLLENKWKLCPDDKDMIVMQHQVGYTLDGQTQQLISSLVVKGIDSHHTAMAKTVGLPLAIVAKLLLEEKINLTGVHIPVRKEIYEPVLKELDEMGICFSTALR